MCRQDAILRGVRRILKDTISTPVFLIERLSLNIRRKHTPIFRRHVWAGSFIT